MALVATTNVIAEVLSAVRIAVATDGTDPITDATTDVQGFETAIDLTNIESFSYTLPSGETETEYDTYVNTQNTTTRRAKSQKTVDVVSGLLVTAGDSKPSVTFSTVLTQTQFSALRDIHQNAERFFLMALVTDSAGDGSEWVHIFGKLTGDFNYESAPLVPIEFTIQAGEAHGSAVGGAFGDYNTAVTTSTIASEGFDDTSDAFTPTDLLTGEYDTLIGGSITFKAHS